MIQMAMNTAVRNQTDKMQPCFLGLSESILDCLITRQLAFFNRFVYSGKVLVNDSARSKVQVANLGITHLTGRQADVQAAGTQTTTRISLVKAIMKRRSGQ
jgi:hypothetical protein